MTISELKVAYTEIFMKEVELFIFPAVLQHSELTFPDETQITLKEKL